MYSRLSSWSELYCPWIWCTLILNIVILPVDTGRCRFTHTRHTFQWRLWWPVDEIIQTLIWNIYLQDIKLIFHMTYKQREMNSLPVILTYFMQGGEKCLFFAITSLLIQLWIAQFQNGKTKLYTAEIHVSRKCTLKDHFFETFLILCRIKNKTYISQQLTTLYKPRWWWMWYIVLKIKTHFESTLKKQKFKNHWNLNISLTWIYAKHLCYVKNVCHLSKDSWDPTCTFFLS